ncbi:Secreted Zn-dependent peptidases, insulinase-like [Modicisalibacter muralis]|uniref:Protease 3 n=1 Tax=Modicisalibacter muralis TaxID=119000 RepID=A0A1G9Q9B1_9GAMM|nr:insulinase family protein [Halomonas muralis]SDM07550.1 Secreted Zn-dependent peptidases, insulinase-like [Halomonas muralis]
MRLLQPLSATALGLIGFGLLLGGCQAVPEDSPEVVTPITSPNDSRDYRALTLDNGLEVLLVSDPEADRAAASMNVSVGSAQDPQAMPGLAHFLEHMLFLGTDRYPEADSYQQYLSQHGGNHNAFTASQDTNYFFDIEPGALPGALDRFSRFFIAPRFNPEYVERERNAVHSEYQARLRDDGRRINEALDQALNPEHPTTGFSVGSLATLNDDEQSLRKALIDFYENHYGAGVMHLAVVAPQSLDTLEILVRERFAEVPNRDLTRAEIPERLLTPAQLPAKLAAQSLGERRQVRFLFPVDDPIDDYRNKSLSYLANLLGHEGEGSLLAALREAGWADGLSAGGARGDGDDALLSVNISLTPEGAEHLDRIQASLFAMIERIREKGLDSWRYQEQARLAEQSFRFQQRGEPIHVASSLAMNLAYYPLEDVQYGNYRMDGFEPDKVREILAKLTPERLLRVYSGPNVEGERTTQWFDTPYRLTPVESWPQAAPLSGLSLPEPNPYIAEDLELLPLDTAKPELLADGEHYTLWYRPDSEFGTPRVEWRFSLQNPETSSSPRNAALTHLLAGWLGDSLNEALYPARLAGQEVSAYAHARGLTLSFSGWRDRQERVMQRVLDQLQAGDITTDSVARVKLGLMREWRNAPQSPLYQQLSRTLGSALIRPQHSEAALLEAIEPLDAEALRDFRQRFLDRLYIESLVVGNLKPALARREGLLVINSLAPSVDASAIPELTPLNVPASAPTLHPHSTRNDSAVLRYLQGPDRSLGSQARLAVLGQLIEAPFYTQLRTEEQLGYIVTAGYRPLLDGPGLSLLVQSPSADVAHIQSRIAAFLEAFDTRVAQLDDATLQPYRDAVRDRLLERDPSLTSLTNRLWYQLALGDTDFNHRQRLAERVMALDANGIRQAWQAVREAPAQTVSFSPETTPSDVAALTADFEPLPEGR